MTLRDFPLNWKLFLLLTSFVYFCHLHNFVISTLAYKAFGNHIFKQTELWFLLSDIHHSLSAVVLCKRFYLSSQGEKHGPKYMTLNIGPSYIAHLLRYYKLLSHFRTFRIWLASWSVFIDTLSSFVGRVFIRYAVKPFFPLIYIVS